MKFFVFLLALTLPVLAAAQNDPGMSEAQMQQMMQGMQAMQNCMQNVDQAALQTFEQRAKQMQAEVEALCAAGKRDEAQERALAFGKETAQNKALQEMKKCGEMMQGMAPKLPKVAQSDEPEQKKSHICDGQGN